ncbi:hypothetical protein E2C01_022196 [Portunus trituberculatus]|uniref:Uncharacterized protein n=1 Tax=Portunus trituberculatus TaxID=210409 RepID=A0A5B7E6D4_PORTR|nr:hypothetical protein [Portunus trituberculatus]
MLTEKKEITSYSEEEATKHNLNGHFAQKESEKKKGTTRDEEGHLRNHWQRANLAKAQLTELQEEVSRVRCGVTAPPTPTLITASDNVKVFTLKIWCARCAIVCRGSRRHHT